MPSKAIRKRQQQNACRRTEPEEKLNGQKLSNSDGQVCNAPDFSSTAAPTAIVSKPPSNSVTMSFQCSSASSASTTFEESPLRTPNEISSPSSATTVSEASSFTSPTKVNRKRRRQNAAKQPKVENWSLQSYSAQEKDALDNLLRWTWATAITKPPRPRTPELGPMDEDPCYDDQISTGYQGMPREQCQQLIDLKSGDAMFLERIYRVEKEMEIAGFRSVLTPEELFKEKADQHKMVMKAEHQIKAEQRATKVEADAERLGEVPVMCRAYEEETDWNWAEEVQQLSKNQWPKWEGEIQEQSHWPKWGEEQIQDWKFTC